MDRVQSARVFIEIVERGSMIAAADSLDMSRSMVTRYLSEIESWANARLLHRSTRRLSLTTAGEGVLEHCRKLIDIADDIPVPAGDVSVNDIEARNVSGHLRIACAHYAAEHVLLPVLKTYYQRYPDVTIELQINNETVDLIEQRIDLALRISSELDPNLIAKRVGTCRSVLCASDDYIEQRGMPLSLEDLQNHECLIYSYFGRHGLWRFMKEGEPISQPVSGRLVASDSEILLSASLKSMGISYQPRADAQPYLDSGALMEILPEYQTLDLGIYGVYQSRKKMPQALRLLLDMLSIM
jgi:DNA-binding transcriptional LysR family regulator